MKRKIWFCALLISVITICGAKSAHATVLGFDDLTSNNSGIQINSLNSSYGGLTWDNNWYVLDTPYFALSGYENGDTSPENVLYNGFGDDVEITGAFNWTGANFTAAWNDGLSVTFKGFSGTTELYSDTISVSTSEPTWFGANYLGIDKLTFHSFGGTPNANYTNGSGVHFAMDNFTFNESQPVPEPATLALLGIGLVGLASEAARRKWKKKAVDKS